MDGMLQSFDIVKPQILLEFHNGMGIQGSNTGHDVLRVKVEVASAHTARFKVRPNTERYQKIWLDYV